MDLAIGENTDSLNHIFTNRVRCFMYEAGKIYTFYEVTCGICQHVEHPPGWTKKHTRQLLKDDYGWSKTKKHGWICRNCKNKLREQA